jgi:hypothetical protein
MEQPLLIFSLSSDKAFEDFHSEDTSFNDAKLSISFESQDMMEESLILLRFNCPESSCAYIAGGWNDLKIHTRAMHGRQLWCEG